MLDLHTIFPPLLYVGAARCDSPISVKVFPAFEADANFFAANQSRRTYIRASFPEEFDPPKELGEWLQATPLQLLVTKIAEQTHFVAPVYRGKPFWIGQQKSDVEIAAILAEMQRREGIDEAEYRAFESRILKQLGTAINNANSAGITH